MVIFNVSEREIGTRNSRVTLMARPQCIPIAAEEDEKIGNDFRVFLTQISSLTILSYSSS